MSQSLGGPIKLMLRISYEHTAVLGLGQVEFSFLFSCLLGCVYLFPHFSQYFFSACYAFRSALITTDTMVNNSVIPTDPQFTLIFSNWPTAAWANTHLGPGLPIPDPLSLLLHTELGWRNSENLWTSLPSRDFHTYVLTLTHTYMKGAGEKRTGDSFKVEHLTSAGLCPTYHTQWATMVCLPQELLWSFSKWTQALRTEPGTQKECTKCQLWWWQFCLQTDITHCQSFCPSTCGSTHRSTHFPSIYHLLVGYYKRC